MRRSSTWLPVLLSFALVLNGIAGASASTRMLMQHDGVAHKAARVQVPSKELASQPPPCHEMTGMAQSEADTGPVALTKTTNDRGHSADCCKSGMCGCECMHQSQVVIATGMFSEPAIVHATSVRAMKPAHPEAFLTDLIRPPIG